MLPTLQIGPLSAQTHLLIILIGFVIASSVAEKSAYKFNIDANMLSNLILLILIAGILGARVGYILKYPSVFLENPLAIFSLNPVMLNGDSGYLFGFLVGFYYGQKHEMRFWQILDALTPFFAVMTIAISLSHLASGSHYGIPMKNGWGIQLYGELRYPTQIYELLFALLITSIIWPSKPRGKDSGNILDLYGLTALTFALMVSVAQIIIATYRADMGSIIGVLRFSQVGWWLIMVFCLVLIHKKLQEASEKIESTTI